MNNTEIANKLKTLLPNAEWTFVGNANNESEFLANLIYDGVAPSWNEVLEAEIVEPTVEDKLASVGLSIDDLKAALGLGGN